MFLSLFLHCVISVHLCLSTYKRYNIHSVIVQTQILQNLSVMLQTLINASVWISSSCKEFSMIWNSTCCSNSSHQFKATTRGDVSELSVCSVFRCICGDSQPPHLLSTTSSVRCSSSLLDFSLLLIISRMVTVRLNSRLSLSIFSYDASSFLRFWRQTNITVINRLTQRCRPFKLNKYNNKISTWFKYIHFCCDISNFKIFVLSATTSTSSSVQLIVFRHFIDRTMYSLTQKIISCGLRGGLTDLPGLHLLRPPSEGHVGITVGGSVSFLLFDVRNQRRA